MLKKINSAHIFHQFSYKIGIVNDNIIWLYGHIMRAQCKRHEDLNGKKTPRTTQANGSANNKHTILWAIKFTYMKGNSSSSIASLKITWYAHRIDTYSTYRFNFVHTDIDLLEAISLYPYSFIWLSFMCFPLHCLTRLMLHWKRIWFCLATKIS